jgi:hypothetical protein
MPQTKQFADNPLHKKNSIYTMVGKALIACPPNGFDQTTRRRRLSRCVEGARALGWVIATPQAKQFAKAAVYHGENYVLYLLMM